MMRIYISGPITGFDGYMQRFEAVERLIEQRGLTAVNPAAVNARLPPGTTYAEYMRMSMTMIDMCDAILLLEGWTDSRGARFEKQYAEITGRTILREQDFREGMEEWRWDG